ncbi:MAG: D-alanine--D-alanine ligase, partial [Chloroflexi bacterium]|nr:D-alanine--D-alanine ligase [Chloroflexota bacterium]
DSLYFGGTKAVCPAQIPKVTQRQIAEMAQAAFHLIGCRGYARVDMRLDEEEQPTIIEVNPNPDISPGAGAALQAKVAGMDYPQFIARIISLALETKTP